jgi:hypothetical protein
MEGSNQEKFGTGSFVGDIMKDDEFFKLSIEDQARFLGQRNGCPVVEELIDPDHGRGPEKMKNRYAEINFWYGFISREVSHYNQPLFEKFSKSIPRKEGETVGKHEPESVPDNYAQTMAPLQTLPGFSLPRMLTEQIQSGKDIDERKQKLVTGLQVVEDAVKESQAPAELMARVAEGLVKDGANIDNITKLMLGQGWMDEHNAHSLLNEGRNALQEFAPTIWEHYEGLTPEQRQEKGFVI